MSIRKARPDEERRIAATLAQAFFDDPVFGWACPDDHRRHGLLPDFFALFAETMMVHDEIYVARDCAGAALRAPPGRAAVPDEDAAAFGGRMEEISGPDAERMLAISKLIDAHHPDGSFWFLQFMGVEPERQGHGIGSALLVKVLERCDREGVSAYLDATSPANKRLYERHGFRAGEAYAPDGGPQLWPMWRHPAGA
jgi:GNAT superfamily N-acetyltransferase